MQSFKLPEPVLCIGGFILVEFLGRVQRCDIDDLYYIWYIFSSSSPLPVVLDGLKAFMMTLKVVVIECFLQCDAC